MPGPITMHVRGCIRPLTSPVACEQHRYRLSAARTCAAGLPRHRARWQCRCGAAAGSSGDLNQMQTALNTAIAAEDWRSAAQLRDQINAALQRAGGHKLVTGWQDLGMPGWLADRAERLGYRFATEVQRQAAGLIAEGRDVVLKSPTGSGKTLAFLLPLMARLSYPPETFPEDLKGPQLVIMVPTRELGVQTCMLIYKLFGGSVNPGVPGDKANMFTYVGPRGLKVKGVLDKEEVLFAKTQSYLSGAHVIVGLPACLAELSQPPNALKLFEDIRAVAVDEVDACMVEQQDSMQLLLSEAVQHQPKPLVAFIGATVHNCSADTATAMGWMDSPASVQVGGDAGQVPSALRHRFLVVEPQRKLAVLCRQLRQDLQTQGLDTAPARVVVFCRSQEAAQAAAAPVRNVLWGDHKVSVLLPEGEEPIKALHAFRDNAASLLLATPRAARGLDLPAVSHVYNMDPPEDAVEYIHSAGRTGRIGAPVEGVVTTLCTQEQLPHLQAMAQELGLQLEEQPQPSVQPNSTSPGDTEGVKKDLEELWNLY